MVLKSVRVPAELEGPFAAAEPYVERLFADFVRTPENGTVLVGDERYVILRCESLYLGWFGAMTESFGKEAAHAFIYNTAREIGKSDSLAFAKQRGVSDPVERLAAGPIHFAHAGWAFVDILPDSAPATDDSYFMHYFHPNTFESAVVLRGGTPATECTCLFSAGYSAGWCSSAFDMEVHGRELRCVSKGDKNCEFIMAPSHKLEQHQKRLLADG